MGKRGQKCLSAVWCVAGLYMSASCVKEYVERRISDSLLLPLPAFLHSSRNYRIFMPCLKFNKAGRILIE